MNWLSGLALSLLLALSSLTTSPQPTPARAIITVSDQTMAAIVGGLIHPVATTAGSVEVIDLTTGREIYGKDTAKARPMASLTKLMTALVILKDHQLTDVMTVDPAVQSLDGTGSQALGLIPGDKLTVDQALHGLLIYSANDMAVSLAAWDAGSEAVFVTKMNQMAVDIGLTDTHYANADGLDAVNHISSARDLAKLSKIVLQSPTVRDIVKQRTGQFTTQLGHTYRFTSTNQALSNANVQGLKTGYTAGAGECLITYAVHDGHAILTVVLGSSDRFGESTQLLNALAF